MSGPGSNDCERLPGLWSGPFPDWTERPMQTVLVSCAFGAVCTMVLWVISNVAAKRDRVLQRGKLLAPEDL